MKLNYIYTLDSILYKITNYNIQSFFYLNLNNALFFLNFVLLYKRCINKLFFFYQIFQKRYIYSILFLFICFFNNL